MAGGVDDPDGVEKPAVVEVPVLKNFGELAAVESDLPDVRALDSVEKPNARRAVADEARRPGLLAVPPPTKAVREPRRQHPVPLELVDVEEKRHPSGRGGIRHAYPGFLSKQ
jgi:hypothetical protein